MPTIERGFACCASRDRGPVNVNVNLQALASQHCDVKNDLKAVADAGWLMMNNGSIVDASSGGRARSNTDCQACSC